MMHIGGPAHGQYRSFEGDQHHGNSYPIRVQETASIFEVVDPCGFTAIKTELYYCFVLGFDGETRRVALHETVFLAFRGDNPTDIQFGMLWDAGSDAG